MQDGTLGQVGTSVSRGEAGPFCRGEKLQWEPRPQIRILKRPPKLNFYFNILSVNFYLHRRPKSMTVWEKL